MSDGRSRRFVWGWLRLALGWAQMALAGAVVVALIAVGIRPVTWALVTGALAAVAASRIIYRGRPGPQPNGRD